MTGRRNDGVTGRPESDSRGPTRRGFLARVGATAGTVAVGALAGCGYRPGGGDVRWRTDHGSRVDDASETDVAGSVLFSISRSVRGFDFEAEEWYHGAAVTAYGTDRGRERWRETLSTPLSAHTVDPGGAAVGFDDTIVRFGFDGPRRRVTVDGEPRAVALAGERLYAVTDGSTLVSHADGDEQWAVPLDSDGSTSDRPGSRPFLDANGDLVVCVTPGGLVGFDVDGSRRWTRDDRRMFTLTVSHGLVLVATGRRLLALDAASGGSRWTVEGVVGDVVPTVTPDVVYVRSRETLLAFDHDGGRLWSRRTGRTGQHRPIAAGSRGACVVDRDGLTAVDTGGEVRWTVDYDSVSAGPFLTDTGVVVAADGDLVCHRL